MTADNNIIIHSGNGCLLVDNKKTALRYFRDQNGITKIINMTVGTEARSKVTQMWENGHEITQILSNGCTTKVDNWGYKNVRYPNSSLEKYDPNGKLISRFDGVLKLHFIFNKPR